MICQVVLYCELNNYRIFSLDFRLEHMYNKRIHIVNKPYQTGIKKEQWMRLFDLAAYAREKYHITEQFRWPEHPGYSVLVDPYSEKWAALLMRRWDPNLGESIEVCDIWCGKEVLDEYKLPYLSMPYRMHGEPWVGVLFDSNTDPDVVYRLFDKAMQARRLHGFTIIFEDDMAGKGSQYQDTPIPPKGKPFSREGTAPATPRRNPSTELPAQGTASL